ncbi:NfeD family protein [Albidovulum sp.]|uniref:NfeD family protein n=1 Tax=Albidovulum sp. TaxID=1872424 RepID=UPI001D96233E|nr:hypothetical protein [Paracoccaceae bacterium]MCC0045229.1 hypothetical protein [Defluviimonas sp.]HPE25710.1 hypothetical protein [Albidovulum sp.]MCB2134154.1 hypothetical protein [Paracoccaceae bacterium]MCB2138313.1 hypothetical protein [Paracoccaceae bacterium]
MALWQEWWVWLTAGAVLAILEVALPGFIFLGFACGAVVVGIAIWAGFLGGSLSALLLAFAVASLACWVGLRKFFAHKHAKPKIWEKDINDN